MYKKRVITLICALGVATAGFSLMGVVSKADTDLTDLTEPELSETEVVAEETCETEEIIETSVCEESEKLEKHSDEIGLIARALSRILFFLILLTPKAS